MRSELANINPGHFQGAVERARAIMARMVARHGAPSLEDYRRAYAGFGAEWPGDDEIRRRQQSKDLAPVHAVLAKWRHFASTEMKDPGSYFRLLAKAERITRTGENPDAVPIEEVKALISQRLGQ